MLKVDGSTEKHWVIGHPAMALTGRAFHDELHVFASGAQNQIDALLEINPNIARLDLKPALVEVTVKLCSEEEAAAHKAHQDQWRSERRQKRPATATR